MEMYDLKSAAHKLRLGISEFIKQAKEIPYTIDGNKIYFKKDDIERYKEVIQAIEVIKFIYIKEAEEVSMNDKKKIDKIFFSSLGSYTLAVILQILVLAKQRGKKVKRYSINTTSSYTDIEIKNLTPNIKPLADYPVGKIFYFGRRNGHTFAFKTRDGAVAIDGLYDARNKREISDVVGELVDDRNEELFIFGNKIWIEKPLIKVTTSQIDNRNYKAIRKVCEKKVLYIGEEDTIHRTTTLESDQDRIKAKRVNYHDIKAAQKASILLTNKETAAYFYKLHKEEGLSFKQIDEKFNKSFGRPRICELCHYHEVISTVLIPGQREKTAKRDLSLYAAVAIHKLPLSMWKKYATLYMNEEISVRDLKKVVKKEN